MLGGGGTLPPFHTAASFSRWRLGGTGKFPERSLSILLTPISGLASVPLTTALHPLNARAKKHLASIAARQVLWLFQSLCVRNLEVSTRTSVNVTHHVEVVVIDVDHFLRVLVNQRVWYWPTNASRFAVIDRALVVSVVQLRGADLASLSEKIDTTSIAKFITTKTGT